MAVQDTGVGLVRAPPAPSARQLRSVRRLPVQKDWPMLAILAAQIGILVGLIALWQAAADRGWACHAILLCAFGSLFPFADPTRCLTLEVAARVRPVRSMSL